MANAPSSNAAAAKAEPIQFIDLQAQRKRIEK